MNRIKEQLKKQIKFLRTSCNTFDKGDWEEAIRIATCVRVLLHDTKKSTSILKQLNAKNINLFSTRALDTKRSSEPGMQFCCGFAMGVIQVGLGTRSSYGPDLSDYALNSSILLPFEEWWERQVVWPISREHQLTRKFIILTAANKDGGAHVDEKLPEEYQKLSNETFGTITAKVNGQVIRETNVINMHLVSIRTIANELLKSPEFMDLLK